MNGAVFEVVSFRFYFSVVSGVMEDSDCGG